MKWATPLWWWTLRKKSLMSSLLVFSFSVKIWSYLSLHIHRNKQSRIFFYSAWLSRHINLPLKFFTILNFLLQVVENLTISYSPISIQFWNRIRKYFENDLYMFKNRDDPVISFGFDDLFFWFIDYSICNVWYLPSLLRELYWFIKL